MILYHIFVSTKTVNIMTTQLLRNKVEAKLIKNGNNVNDVKKMKDLHFERASKKSNTVSEIAYFIRVIY